MCDGKTTAVETYALANCIRPDNVGGIYYSAFNELHHYNPVNGISFIAKEDDIIGSVFMAADKSVLFGGGDMELYKTDQNGTTRLARTKGTIISIAAAADGPIYYATKDKSIYALKQNRTVLVDDSVAGLNCIHAAKNGKLYYNSYNTLKEAGPDGKCKPVITLGDCNIASISSDEDGQVYISDCEKKIYSVNPAGDVVESYALPLKASHIHIIGNGYLIYDSINKSSDNINTLAKFDLKNGNHEKIADFQGSFITSTAVVPRPPE